MVGKTWRDVQRGGGAGPAVPRPPAPGSIAAPDPHAVLHGLPRLGPLLEQRAQLERRMHGLIGGPDAGRDPREAARFPVMGLPQRRAEYRRWEDQRATSAAQALAQRRAERAGELPLRDSRPADTPYAQIARWFAERDGQVDAAREGAVARRGDQAGLMQRLDARNAAARANAAGRGADASEGRSSGRSGESLPDRFGDRDPFEARDGQPASDPGLGGDRVRPRRPADPLEDRPRTRPGPDPLEDRAAAAQDRLRERITGLEALGRRADRARERIIGERSEARRAARAAARVGERAEELSGRLRDLDQRLGEAGMEEERGALRDSGIGKLSRALDKTADLARKPQRMVDRANQEWEKRRDEISGILPVDRGFRERVGRMLGVEVGTIEDFEERMNRVRERAMRKRTAEREQERRDEQRRERARERQREQRREEGRGR